MEIFVHRYLGVLSASIATFAATNVDDAFLLTFFFARRIPVRRIVAGQYAGFAAIILLSLLGVWGALAIPHRWIHFLGLLPLAMGIRLLFAKRRKEPQAPNISNSSIASIALVTLSNGADNVGVYVPLFVNSRAYLWLILSVYAVMVAMWCALGRWLGNRTLILRSVDRWGHWVVPLVFVGLGIYVLLS